MKPHNWRLLARDFEHSKSICRECGMVKLTKSNRSTARFPESRYELNGVVAHGKVPPCVVPSEVSA